MKFSLIISTRPDSCANTSCNNIFSTYSNQSIINDGIYLVSEILFVWSNVCVDIVINYYCRPIRVESYLLWWFHCWREYVKYTIIWNWAEYKGSVFSVTFGRLLSYLPTGFTWIFILPPGYDFSFQSQLLAPLDIWAWLSESWRSYVKINHQLLEWLMGQRRDEHKNNLEASLLFVK